MFLEAGEIYRNEDGKIKRIIKNVLSKTILVMDILGATPVGLALQSFPYRAGPVTSLKPAVMLKALGLNRRLRQRWRNAAHVIIPLESPLDRKEIKPDNPKGSQPWISTGRTEAEASILWPSDVNNRLTGKDPNARKELRQEEKGETEDKMIG